MIGRTWRRLAVAALCSTLAATALAQAPTTQGGIPGKLKLLTKAPKGAVVLFAGKPEQMDANWRGRDGQPIRWTVAQAAVAPTHKDDQGAAKPAHQDIVSKQEFGDCYLHVEFNEPATGSGNSGVGLQGRYEIQILNSFGQKPEAHGCGAFYSQTAPMVVASKPAGEWQSYDIFFRAPRFDADGKVVEPARATVYQNGTLIHKNQAFNGPTGIQYGDFVGEVAKAPIVIQGDHDVVTFRNIWVVPKAF